MTGRNRWPTLIAILVVAAAAVSACEGAVGLSPYTPTGVGGGATTSSTNTGAAGEGGMVCVTPPDYYCDEISDCDCVLCSHSALCEPGGCLTDSWCLEAEDSCTCSDCDWDPRCLDLLDVQCDSDGICDYEREGCRCEDCAEVATCQDNLSQCAGGAADGLCDLATENCWCPDCMATEECLCSENTYCNVCICPDCWTDPYCNDPLDCEDDGLCDWDRHEGCHCPDCAGLLLCAGYP